MCFHYATTTSAASCRLSISGAFGLFAKHALQSTGLPCIGLNGTMVTFPHSAHITDVSIRRRPVVPSLLALHCLQWVGSLTNPFSRKNSCSPAEKTKITPQPTHRTSRSEKFCTNPPLRLEDSQGQKGPQSFSESRCAAQHQRLSRLEKYVRYEPNFAHLSNRPQRPVLWDIRCVRMCVHKFLGAADRLPSE